MPRHWLAKSEPDVYSIDDLARDGTTFWDGVRNHAARNHLRAMREGDLVLFYHSNSDPSAVVGVMEVVGEPRPDPPQFDPKDDHFDPKSSRDDPTWWGVDARFVERLPTPVTLHDVKAEPRLREMQLVKLSRLSVSQVTPAEWKVVLAMGRRKVPAKR